MRAEMFCRHFLLSQNVIHVEAITENSSQGYEGVCDSYTWMQMSTVDKYVLERIALAIGGCAETTKTNSLLCSRNKKKIHPLPQL